MSSNASQSDAPMTRAKERVVWIDTAKGICILLVVVHHAIGGVHDKTLLSEINNALLPLRMPLLFFCSGVISYYIRGVRFQYLIERRLISLIYIYILWAIVKFASLDVLNKIFGGVIYKDFFSIFYAPPTTLWFVYALFLFSAAVALVRFLPDWLVLAMSGLIYVFGFGPGAIDHLQFSEQLSRNLVFFVAGIIFSRQARELPEQMSSNWALVALPWLVASFCLYRHAPQATQWLFFLMSATAIVCGALVASALARTTAVTPLAFLGRNSLPIYVGHFLAIYPLKFFSSPNILLEYAVLFGAAAVGVLGPLVLHQAALRFGFGWLYECPAVLRRVASGNFAADQLATRRT